MRRAGLALTLLGSSSSISDFPMLLRLLALPEMPWATDSPARKTPATGVATAPSSPLPMPAVKPLNPDRLAPSNGFEKMPVTPFETSVPMPLTPCVRPWLKFSAFSALVSASPAVYFTTEYRDPEIWDRDSKPPPTTPRTTPCIPVPTPATKPRGPCNIPCSGSLANS